MSELHYPTRVEIERWVKLLKENPRLKVSLPNTDDDWYEHVLTVVQRVQYSYGPNTLHRRAAELFYNANKAHNYIDGNKRTSIVIVYLFYVLNNHYVDGMFNFRDMAKRVARSKGRENHDKWIEKIEQAFAGCTGTLWSTIATTNKEEQ